MNPAVTALLSILGGFLAGSGGFWVYLKSRYVQRDSIEALTLGLAHDKIICLCIEYIEQGYVNTDEYSDLMKYFWEPYSRLGGDGSAERVIKLVQTLPLLPERRTDRLVRQATDEALPKGAQNVIKRIEEGEDRLEPRKD